MVHLVKLTCLGCDDYVLIEVPYGTKQPPWDGTCGHRVGRGICGSNAWRYEGVLHIGKVEAVREALR